MTIKTIIYSETDRLILRNVHIADTDQLVEYASDWNILDMMNGSIPEKYSKEIATDWIIKHAQDSLDSESISWAIVLKVTDAFIGSIQLRLDKPRKIARLSYWIARPFWNQGIATEAGKSVIKYGFNKLGVDKIEAEHFRRNPASGKVLKKLGFQYISTINKQEGLAKRMEDFEQYAIFNNIL